MCTVPQLSMLCVVCQLLQGPFPALGLLLVVLLLQYLPAQDLIYKLFFTFFFFNYLHRLCSGCFNTTAGSSSPEQRLDDSLSSELTFFLTPSN